MHTYNSFESCPFRVNAYRTDEVLFFHIIPPSWEKYRKQFRFFTTLFCCLLLVLFGCFLTDNIIFTDVIRCILILVGINSLLVFYFYLLTNEHALIRIDRNTIHKTTWYFKIGFFVSINRPNKIVFEKRDGRWCFVAKGCIIPLRVREHSAFDRINQIFVSEGIIPLRVREHEFLWMRELIEQFENEVPAVFSDIKSEIAPVLMTDVKCCRCILDDMEYQGQKLYHIPDPTTKQYTFKKVTTNKSPDELSGTLHVRCSRCHSMLPTDYVLADTAMAQCPCCGFLFEVTDLKRHSPPQHSHIKLQTEENVLKLHQRPRFSSLPLFILSIIVSIDIGVAAFFTVPYLIAHYIQAQKINPANVSPKIDFLAPNGNHILLVQITSVIGIIHVLCFLVFLWSIFVHRFIEFRINEVWFRIRWLCFWWSWTVPRSCLEASRLIFSTQYWSSGIQIPYGKSSFYIGAKITEIPWIVGEINYWLLTHPPDGFSVSDHFPKFENNQFNSVSENSDNLIIGGVTEMNDKEICWHCCCCGHRLLTEELDFPNHTASCPDCHKTLNLSQLRHYAVERIAVKPELSYLFVEETETEQRIECSIISTKKSERYAILFGHYIVLIFFTVILIGLPCFLATKFFILLNRQPEINRTVVFASIFVVFWFSLPFYVMFASIHEEIRRYFTAWTTRFSDGNFELTRRYKNCSETIRIEKDRIAEFRRGEPIKNFGEPLKNYSFFSRFPSNLESRGEVRNEMLLTDGTILYLPILSESKKVYGLNNWLVNTWNKQLHDYR
jgi:hypothetical protein